MKRNFEQYNDIDLYNMLKSEKKIAEAAFAELYNRYSSRIYAYCRRFLGNREDAQDVYQETFENFLESAKETREMTNIPAFLLKIARNLCVNVRRKDKKAVSFEDYMVPEGNPEKDDELINLVKTAIDLLPEDLKDMFILREYDGLSYTEIVEVTGNPMTTVKIRLYRAKQRIREILSPYFNDDAKKEKNFN